MAAITKYQESTAILRPQSLAEAMSFAELIAKSDIVPQDYKGKAGNIVVAIMMGAELGLAPMQSLQNVAVIRGRPAVWGDALLALVQSAADCRDVSETFDESTMTATCTIVRGDRSPVTRAFSKADAMTAKLWGAQGPWTQYPKRMLQMRARGFAIRDAYADRIKGLMTVEEAQDIPEDKPARQASRVTSVREVQRHAPAALPASSVPESALRAVVDAEIDPADYVIRGGKNDGKRLGDLPSQSLHWYAEEYRGSNDDLRRNSRLVIDARIAEREQQTRETTAAVEADGDSWGLSSEVAS